MTEAPSADGFFVTDNSDFFTTPMETGDIIATKRRKLSYLIKQSRKEKKKRRRSKTPRSFQNRPLNGLTRAAMETTSAEHRANRMSEEVINAPAIARPLGKQTPKLRNLVRMMS